MPGKEKKVGSEKKKNSRRDEEKACGSNFICLRLRLFIKARVKYIVLSNFHLSSSGLEHQYKRRVRYH